MQNLNIPMVIATNAPINDERATQFSITFFEELATKRQSVRAAFDAAIDAAKVKGHIDFEIRSRAAGRRDDIKASSWGLYYQDAHADLMNIWRLPEKPRASNTNQYLKNAIDLIYEQFETALKMQGEESRGQDVILKRLPYSISEPIRKLLAPSDNSGQLFYDRPSSERFQMLLYAYKSIVDFVTYVLLAQLWEQKRLPQNALNTEGVVEVLKTWLNKPTHQETEQSPLPFLLELMTFLKDNKVLFFLEELNQVRVELNNADVKDAVVFLEKQIRENPKAQLNYLCDETEQHLAVVLHQFGFLVNYGLTSVKDINVLFYQHNDVPNFEHKIVKLQQALTDLEDRTETEAYHYKTATILLRRFDDKSKFLYLSPFLIDENAYTNSLKAKLCAFVSYNSMTRQFNFSHISKPKDIILIEQKKTNIMTRIKGNTDANDTYFTLINGQFSAFCKAVLGKTLEEL